MSLLLLYPLGGGSSQLPVRAPLYVPRPPWVPEWQGSPSAKPGFLGGQVPTKQWHYDADFNTWWVGEPEASAAIQILTSQKMFAAGGQPPTKQWHYDADFNTWWQGNPWASAAIPLLTQQIIYSAGGQGPTKQWHYDYDSGTGWWQGQPDASAVIPLLTVQIIYGAGGQVPTKPWHYDYDSNTWWQGSPQSMPPLNLSPSSPKIPPQWEYNFEVLPQWQGNPLSAFALNLPTPNTIFTGPFYVPRPPEVPQWQGAPQSIPVANRTAAAAPIVPPQWEYNFDPPLAWQGSPLSSAAIPLLTTQIIYGAGGQVPTKQWHYDYLIDYPQWQGAPLSISLGILSSGATPAIPPQWEYNYQIDAPLWLGYPLGAAAMLYGATPPTIKNFEWLIRARRRGKR